MVADAIIAMMTDHPYARRCGLEQALAEVRRERGGQFDPEVVDIAHSVECDSLAWAVSPQPMDTSER
jgi:HD-GYP domain-containing protein (c-di-GMP phosphodiesterase class II)